MKRKSIIISCLIILCFAVAIGFGFKKHYDKEVAAAKAHSEKVESIKRRKLRNKREWRRKREAESRKRKQQQEPTHQQNNQQSSQQSNNSQSATWDDQQQAHNQAAQNGSPTSEDQARAMIGGANGDLQATRTANGWTFSGDGYTATVNDDGSISHN
jgi:outer membrane biosynthesis protein TonB